MIFCCVVIEILLTKYPPFTYHSHLKEKPNQPNPLPNSKLRDCLLMSSPHDPTCTDNVIVLPPRLYVTDGAQAATIIPKPPLKPSALREAPKSASIIPILSGAIFQFPTSHPPLSKYKSADNTENEFIDASKVEKLYANSCSWSSLLGNKT